jgi:hypothetical protein
VRPPRAPQFPQITVRHGHERVDDYAWMADREDPRLTAYLLAENAYADHRTAHLEPLREAIFAEIRSRTVETDLSRAGELSGWWYYSRTERGRGYAVHARLRDRAEPNSGPPWCRASHRRVSRCCLTRTSRPGRGTSSRSVTWSCLPTARCWPSRPTARVRSATTWSSGSSQTGAEVDASVQGIGEGLAWSADSRHVFYTRLDRSWRSHEIWRHEVGTPASADVCVLAEPDERMFLGVSVSKDERWILLTSSSKTSTGVWLVDATEPTHCAGAGRASAGRGARRRRAVCRWPAHHPQRRPPNFQVSWAAAARVPTVVEWSDLGLVCPGRARPGGGGLRHLRRALAAQRGSSRPANRPHCRADGGNGVDGFGPPHDVAVAGETMVVAAGPLPTQLDDGAGHPRVARRAARGL